MTSPRTFQHPLIGKVLVIHVKTFVDREAHMRRQLGRFGIPFEFVLEYDATDIDDQLDSTRFAAGANLGKAAKSCCLKHLQALQEIAGLPDHQFGLILEDDVILADNFAKILRQTVDEAALLPKPLTVQLGCANNMHVPRGALRKGQRLYEATQVRAGEAYLIDPEAARRRLAYLAGEKIALPVDHLFNLTDRACGIPFLWLEPTIVEQGSMTGAFRSAIDLKRAGRSLVGQFVHYQMKKVRVAYLDPLFRRNRRF